MDLDQMSRSWAHEQIDRIVMRGFCGLIVLGVSPIIADVASPWLGIPVAVVGLATVAWAFWRLS